YVVETAYGVNSTRTIGISSVMWEPNGDLRGFGFDYSTVTGFGKEFNLSRDCLYAPQRICNWNLTRNFSWTAPVASINLTVYCPPWPPASTNVTFNLSNYWNASAPRYCVNASDCNVSIDSCTNYSCTGIANATCENCTIGNYTGNITTTCVYSRQTGCDFQDLCKGTGFRYADAYSYWYCEDNFFQRQREGGESCSASYHCKSNTCSGTCTAYVEPTPNPFPSPTANITTPVPTAIPLRPPECVYDFECVDEWACTKDNCINEFCVHHALYGCALGVDCKEYGFVEMVNGSIDYCSPDGLWVPQKQLGESCRQNHECLSYYCESFVCNTPDKQSTQGLLDGVTGFISGIIGFFANLFN
ncbi:TPA: hypothetical protein HA318_05745, partial [Candidatus Micrarchaeota archaeon]|nr:hypothetical protein [Candidatus Micrarchaeota archaeon]